MRKTILSVILISMVISFPSNSQGLLKKVANSMKDELLGTGKSGNSASQQPEPSCACSQPEMVLDLGGKLQLDYSEIAINTTEDGSLIVQDRISGNFYLVKGGVTTGPIRPGDPRVAAYENMDDGNMNPEDILIAYKNYISKSGDKYNINFGGKTYGPYSQITQFALPKSGDKFAAIVIENIVVNESEGQKMDEAINKAKTEQEKMDLAMQYAAQMQQKMIAGGGPASMLPKLVTNIPDANWDPTQVGGTIQGKWKYDDVVVSAYTKIMDLKGNTIIAIKPDHAVSGKIFISSDNTRYAAYSYGTLTFSDNTKLTDLFNPQLIKADGKFYLTYMYYSPKRNAIVQCKIAF
jgi:hypothetical protein